VAGKPLIVVAALAVFGLVRWPLEEKATRDFRARRVLPPQAGLSLRERLTQNSYAGVLGGARSLVASLEELAAFTAFEKDDWGQVESRYRLVTDLQPNVPAYWDMGSNLLAYSASSYYRYDWPGPKGGSTPASLARVRMELHDRYVGKGREMLEEGIRKNPRSWKLLAAAAQCWFDPWRSPDPGRAADFFQRAAAAPGAPARLLQRLGAGALSYVPGRENEARALLQALYDEGEQNRTPNVVCTLLDFQLAAGLPPEKRVPLGEIARNPAELLRELRDYAAARRFRGCDISPQLFGIISRLEDQAGVPPGKRLPAPVQKPSQIRPRSLQ
jgi:hypothetical protein